jgi:hypothetical protein
MITGVWVLERLVQLFFFYSLSFYPGLLVALLLLARFFDKPVLLILLGAVFFDFWSGLSFGVITLATAAVFWSVVLVGTFFNLRSSMLVSLLFVFVFSVEFTTIVFLAAKIPWDFYLRATVINSAITLTFFGLAKLFLSYEESYFRKISN